MARRRRGAAAHADVVGARARLLIGLGALVDAEGRSLDRRAVGRWFVPVASSTAPLDQRPGPSIVLDASTYELHLGDTGGSLEGMHPGEDFVGAATLHGVEVFVVDTRRADAERPDLDVRRLRPTDLDEIAARGGLLGGLVQAFRVAVR